MQGLCTAGLLWALHKLIVEVVNPKHSYVTLEHFSTPHLLEDGRLLAQADSDGTDGKT